MINWKSAVCKTNGINIHYTRTGGDKPPLVLLHGLTGNGACWTVVAQALEKEYDIIMPDARGHGESDAPDSGYRYGDHADDVTGLIKSLGVSYPVLLGHSMGGITAAVVTGRNPKMVRGLILADPPFVNVKTQHDIRNSDAADKHRQVLSSSLEELVSDSQVKHPGRTLEIIKLIARARLQTKMAAFDVLTPPYPDYSQLVGSIDVPSLLIIGDKGVVTPSVAEEVKKLNSGIQVSLIPNAGHGLHFDQPELFTSVVKSFIQSIETTN